MIEPKIRVVKSEDDKSWAKYCGFLDLPMEQFMAIQQALLLQQLKDIAGSSVGKKFIKGRVPETIEDFRKTIPLTTFGDYLPELEPGNTGNFPEMPLIWAHTTGGSGFKQVPYTEQFYQKALDNLMAAFILACARNRGESSILEGDRVLFNVAPSPYLSGILARGLAEKFGLKQVIPSDTHDGMDFKEKIVTGFEVALQDGVDIIIAMTSVLVKMGNDFKSPKSRNSKLSKYLMHPAIVYRYGQALLRSKLEKRRVLPRDLWPVKAVIGWGIDTSIFREQVYKDWGKYPYEFYACTEAGLMAMQSWTKKDLTFIPHSNFFEFIPESEWLKNKENSAYQPRTVLISEVKPGERYELVITSFYRMPFIRYRFGHLIRITALEDKEAGIKSPQMVFEARADDLLDIAGFTRLSEKTITQAIATSGFNCEDWSIRKEVKENKPKLHLYLELDHNHGEAEVESVLHQQLKSLDAFYFDLESMLDIRPLEVTLLPVGTFKGYYEEQKRAGVELAQRKPPRMNASDDAINRLLAIAKKRD